MQDCRMADDHDHQGEWVAGSRQRLRTAAENVERLTRELSAERQLRNAAIVELYEGGVRVDTIAADARINRSSTLEIVGKT